MLSVFLFPLLLLNNAGLSSQQLVTELQEKAAAYDNYAATLAEKDDEIEALRGDIADLKEMYQQSTSQLIDEIERLKAR